MNKLAYELGVKIAEEVLRGHPGRGMAGACGGVRRRDGSGGGVGNFGSLRRPAVKRDKAKKDEDKPVSKTAGLNFGSAMKGIGSVLAAPGATMANLGAQAGTSAGGSAGPSGAQLRQIRHQRESLTPKAPQQTQQLFPNMTDRLGPRGNAAMQAQFRSAMKGTGSALVAPGVTMADLGARAAGNMAGGTAKGIGSVLAALRATMANRGARAAGNMAGGTAKGM